jgi:hypothetical protein
LSDKIKSVTYASCWDLYSRRNLNFLKITQYDPNKEKLEEISLGSMKVDFTITVRSHTVTLSALG